MFRKYVSNVSCGTGANYILESPEPRRFAARAYFKPEVPGDFVWRFYFQNTVDSTFAEGSVARRNLSGGNWEILRAVIADGGEIDGIEVNPGELNAITPLSFDGEASRRVLPDEKLWSDEVRFRLPENHYLVFEWELAGSGIPCTPNSIIPTFVNDGGSWKRDDFCPLPALVGCCRSVKKRIAFLGDSITQGCGTTPNGYEMWAGRIAAALQPDYAFWNLGLGWGRGSDAATDGSWLHKAKQNDLVMLAFGVNDILHGVCGGDRGDTAGELLFTIETLVRKLQEAGVEVILATVPPFDFTPAQYREWRAVNLAIPELARRTGCRIFDLERALDGGDFLENIWIYGAHPDGEGGKAAADAFRRSFHTPEGWNL